MRYKKRAKSGEGGGVGSRDSAAAEMMQRNEVASFTGIISRC